MPKYRTIKIDNFPDVLPLLPHLAAERITFMVRALSKSWELHVLYPHVESDSDRPAVDWARLLAVYGLGDRNV